MGTVGRFCVRPWNFAQVRNLHHPHPSPLHTYVFCSFWLRQYYLLIHMTLSYFGISQILKIICVIKKLIQTSYMYMQFVYQVFSFALD